VQAARCAREGELTPDDINALWMSVQAESLGPVFEFMPGYETFWAYIPHFVHSPFYVYAYAFGDGLVNALYAVYEEGGDGFQEKYFDMLKAGGSKHHKELLAPFGLDASDPAFWDKGLTGMIEGFIDRAGGLRWRDSADQRRNRAPPKAMSARGSGARDGRISGRYSFGQAACGSRPGGCALPHYGEALRAMTEHVSDSLISGPCVPMIEMLDEAFDTLSSKRDSFGPEEFTLFVMSKMLGLCDDADEARQFQVGAAQYILKSAKALPDTYKPVIDDARQLLRRSALTRDSGEVVQDSPETARPKQTRPAAKDIAPSSAPEPAAPVADIAAQPRDDSPMQPARPAQPQGARATMQARPPRQLGQTTAMRPGRGGLGFLERTIVVGAFAFVLGLLLMLTLGYVDLDTLLQIVPDSAAQILP
jgi:hypothetical protein